MDDLTRRAVESIADRGDVDWETLEAAATDATTQERLRALAHVAAISRVHSATAGRSRRQVPFPWGPLEVQEWVACGAHGDVYRAWDPRLDRDVALKLVRDPDTGSISIAEGRLLARVHHPNVVAVHGADRIGDEAGIWMEFVHGRTLRQDVEGVGSLDVSEAVRIGVAVCSGLEAIHRAGLLHRDVKAQNVMRAEDGRVVLMDLGDGRDAALPADGLHGTPMYLAPELLDGQQATTASDVYAVGVLLFFLLTGRYPATADSIQELKRVHERRASERLASMSTVPPAISAIVDRALSVDPGRRFSSISDMRAALQDALGPSRTRAPVRVLALLLAGLAVIGVLYVLVYRPPPRRGDPAGIRVVRLPPANLGWPSADGRLYPYVDVRSNALMLWDVQAARARTILRLDGTDESVTAPLMSADGGRVSYGVTTRAGLHELRISNTDGSWQRTLIQAQREYEPVPADWSRDGGVILCWLRQENGNLDLVSVSTGSGFQRLLYSMPPGSPDHARLSPDGRFVVIVAPRQANPHGHDLVIVPSDGAPPYPLLDDTANDTFPLWTADGGRVFFLRDSAEVKFSRDAWVVPVRNGRRTGEPKKLIANVGIVQLPTAFAITDNGDLNSIIDGDTTEAYVGPIDLSGATASEPATRIASDGVGDHVGPSWSPDGATIAYFKITASPVPGHVPLRTLSFLNVASGRVRQVHPPLVILGGYAPQWTPDSSSVIVWGTDADDDGRFGYYRVDVHTGQTLPIKITGPSGAPANSRIDPGGHRFLFADHMRGIVALDLRTGLEKLVVPQPTNVRFRRFALSPDGRSIAVATFPAGTPGRARRIELWTNRHRRELVRARDGEAFDLEAWTPDGKAVLFVEGPPGDQPPQVWRADLAGGEPRPLHLRVPIQPNTLSLSPDGGRVAYPERIFYLELRIVPLPR